MRIAVFDQAADLLSALLLCRQTLPEVVYQVSDRWAVPLEDLVPEPELLLLASQCRWEVTIASSDLPDPISVFRMLSGAWTYRDPLQAFTDGQVMKALKRPTVPGAFYDLTDDEVDFLYILGARTEQESQQILNALGRCLTRGIEGVPILLDPLTGACPFRFFWLVRWNRPDPFVLETASRVWWGPVDRGTPQIFIQWPFSLAIPLPALQALPWGEKAAYALLSKDAPDYLILRRRGQDLVFREIQEVARITTGPAQVTNVIAVRPPERPTLEVLLRLVEEEPRSRLANRANEMAREIHAKQLIYEQTLRRLDSSDPVLSMPEPLILYSERAGAAGEIPYELRRLLIEWADLAADLRSLYYINVRAEQLPKGRFVEGSSVHVVTTGTALGIANSGQVGMRLWEYSTGAMSLNLRPDWAEFGVKIFTPNENYPEIYPDMRPGHVSAARLAEALLPGGSSESESEWIALLLTDREGLLHVVRLRTKDFMPLCDAWQWTCNVNVQLDEPALAAELAENVLSKVWNSIALSLQREVRAAMQSKVNALIPPILTAIAQVDGRVREVQERVNAHKELAEAFRGEEAALDATSAASRRVADEIVDTLSQLKQDEAAIAGALNAIPTILNSLVLVTQDVSARIKRLSEMKSRPKSSGGSRTSVRK